MFWIFPWLLTILFRYYFFNICQIQPHWIFPFVFKLVHYKYIPTEILLFLRKYPVAWSFCALSISCQNPAALFCFAWSVFIKYLTLFCWCIFIVGWGIFYFWSLLHFFLFNLIVFIWGFVELALNFVELCSCTEVFLISSWILTGRY